MSYLSSAKSNLGGAPKERTPLSASEIDKDDAIPGFFIYPTRNYRTTTIKAPMAHKTFSQEQFMLRYYFLSITFNLRFESSSCNSVNRALYYALFIIRSAPIVSTNLLLLKRYTVSFYYSDNIYFSYFIFNNL